MNYLEFDIEDFIMDDFFQKWVKAPDEQSDEFWKQWILEHPEKKKEIDNAMHFIKKVDFNEKWTPSERSKMWSYIESNLEKEKEQNNYKKVKLENNWSWLAIACSLIILCSGALYFYRFRTQETTTAFSETKKVLLNDGSIVTLNANSSIIYKNGWYANSNREVWIKGDAIFEVSKQELKGEKLPFVVHADNLNVEVLGTIFSVSNRRNKKDIALQHGSVKVTDENNTTNTVILRPGEGVSQSQEQHTLIKQEIDSRYYTSWKDKIILFKQKSLTEIAVMMKEWYDINIIIDNPTLKNETFTGSFPTDSVDVFFVKLQKLYPIQVTKKGDAIHLK